tara:strand:- start:386 stop:808 length:423 start_codon:yes stop_codon:yes gene_type:complete
MAISINPVNKTHLNDVIEILQSVSIYRPDKSEYLEKWNHFKSQPNYLGFVAVEGEKVVGYGSIFFAIKIRGGKMGHIDEIAVDVNYRHRGIGTLLVKKLCEIAKEENCYKVFLVTNKDNIKFYEKNNFKSSGLSFNNILN